MYFYILLLVYFQYTHCTEKQAKEMHEILREEAGVFGLAISDEAIFLAGPTWYRDLIQEIYNARQHEEVGQFIKRPDAQHR